ncbi:helix-turn-helix domain-containing protein [Ralstonia nicotianae]
MIKSIDFLQATISVYGGKKGDAAKALGVANNTISNWLKREHVSPAAAVKCAKISGADPAFAEAIAGAETIEDESARVTVLKTIHRAFNVSFSRPLRAMKKALSLAR